MMSSDNANTAPKIVGYLASKRFLEEDSSATACASFKQVYRGGLVIVSSSTNLPPYLLESTWDAFQEIAVAHPESAEHFKAAWSIPRSMPLQGSTHFIVESHDQSVTNVSRLAALTAYRERLKRRSGAKVRERNKAAIALLRSWRSEQADAEEQSQTVEYLKKVLDQDRLSDRKLFP